MQREAIFGMVSLFRGRIRPAHQEGVIAMIEDGLSQAEIAEYLGESILERSSICSQ